MAGLISANKYEVESNSEFCGNYFSGAKQFTGFDRSFPCIRGMTVFFYHYSIGHVLAQVSGWKFLEYSAWPGAIFAVLLFFALSGFCIHGAEWHRFHRDGALRWKDYFVRRLRRIYPVYVCADSIACCERARQRCDLPQGRFVSRATSPRSFANLI